MALRFGADSYQAKIAGLVHDCAKGLTQQQMMDAVNHYNICLDTITITEKELIHGPLGAAMAQDIFEIDDLNILDAIRYHTTGRTNTVSYTHLDVYKRQPYGRCLLSRALPEMAARIKNSGCCLSFFPLQ